MEGDLVERPDVLPRHPQDEIERGIDAEQVQDIYLDGGVSGYTRLPRRPDGTPTLEDDGRSIVDEWDELSLPQLRELLERELNTSRDDLADWLRGEGRAALEAQHTAMFGAGFESEEEFEAEVAAQLFAFEKFQWPDTLYAYIKAREGAEFPELPRELMEMDTGHFAATGELRSAHAELAGHVLAGGGAEVAAEGAAAAGVAKAARARPSRPQKTGGDAAPTEPPEQQEARATEGLADQAATAAAADAVAHAGATEREKVATAQRAAPAVVEGPGEGEARRVGAGAGDGVAAGTAGEARIPSDLDTNGSEGLDEQLAHEVLTAAARQRLREQRLLRKLRAVREQSRIGDAPRREGRAWNRREYDLRRLDLMMHLLDPRRPRALDGGHLSDKAADDVGRHEVNTTHPEIHVHLERPQLFPPSTETQMSPEWIDRRLNEIRASAVQPPDGVYDDQDWAELKGRFMHDLEGMMARRVAMYQTVGMSGLLGGYQEDRAFLEALASRAMPDSHPARGYLRVMTDTIAANAQWPWAYKCKATELAARRLVRVSERDYLNLGFNARA